MVERQAESGRTDSGSCLGHLVSTSSPDVVLEPRGFIGL